MWVSQDRRKMNLDIIKDEIKAKQNMTVQIVVYGMRNKVTRYVGKIKTMYPNIFTLSTDTGEKSFTYADVATGEVKIKYLK